jgi:hypothetical protein
MTHLPLTPKLHSFGPQNDVVLVILPLLFFLKRKILNIKKKEEEGNQGWLSHPLSGGRESGATP